MTPAPLLVLPTKFIPSWNGSPDAFAPAETPEDPPPIPLVRLDRTGLDAFLRAYPTDAHACMYHYPDEDCMPRMGKASLSAGVKPPRMGWLIVDVDTPGHVPFEGAPASWHAQVARAELTIPQMRGAIRWESQHGLKYAWALPPGRRYPAPQGEDFLRMFATYLQSSGLPVDMGCLDWTRVMRLPRVVREGDPRSLERPVEVLGGELVMLQWKPPREPVAGATVAPGPAGPTVALVDSTEPPADPLRRALWTDAESALSVLDPDAEYDTWIRVGLALRDAFGGRGYGLWRAWSERGEKFPGADELERKWGALPRHGTASPVTIRTLFHLAEEAGWVRAGTPGGFEGEDGRTAAEVLAAIRSPEDAFAAEALDAAASLREAGGLDLAVYVRERERMKRELRGILPITDWERAVKERQKGRQRERRIRAAAMRAEGTGARVANFEQVMGEDDEEPVLVRRSLPEIVADVHKATGGWPRTVDGMLFSLGASDEDEDGEVNYLQSQSELLAWLEGQCAVDWTEKDVVADNGAKVRPVNVGTLLSGLQTHVPEAHRYTSVQRLPHWPPIEGVYYLERDLPVATGEVLRDFVRLFNPDTSADAQLLEALILTGAWGGEPGKRPAFVITSDHGRSAGKTSTASAIARVFGGVISTKASDRWEILQQRLLDPSTIAKRFVLVDNVKGALRSEEIEAAITERVINGRRLYVGDGQRTNYLTWVFTANSASLSTDLASRSVIIKIGRPQHSVDFEAAVSDFLEAHGDALLADIVARLQEEETGMVVHNVDRFQAWQRAVLSRFENADELAGLVRARRAEVDEDGASAKQWAAELRLLLIRRGHNPDTERVVIPSAELIDIARAIEHDPSINHRRTWTILRPLLGVGDLADCRRWASGRSGRGLLWSGPHADGSAVPLADREDPTGSTPF